MQLCKEFCLPRPPSVPPRAHVVVVVRSAKAGAPALRPGLSRHLGRMAHGSQPGRQRRAPLPRLHHGSASPLRGLAPLARVQPREGCPALPVGTLPASRHAPQASCQPCAGSMRARRPLRCCVISGSRARRHRWLAGGVSRAASRSCCSVFAVGGITDFTTPHPVNPQPGPRSRHISRLQPHEPLGSTQPACSRHCPPQLPNQAHTSSEHERAQRRHQTLPGTPRTHTGTSLDAPGLTGGRPRPALVVGGPPVRADRLGLLGPQPRKLPNQIRRRQHGVDRPAVPQPVQEREVLAIGFKAAHASLNSSRRRRPIARLYSDLL